MWEYLQNMIRILRYGVDVMESMAFRDLDQAGATGVPQSENNWQLR